MTLGYFLGGGFTLDPDAGKELYEQFPVMRATYEDVSRWTGLTVAAIRSEELPSTPEKRQSAGTIRQAALTFGVADILADAGIRPTAIGGLSLGAMMSSCLAGAVDRRTFFELLAHTRNTPELPSGSPPQGVALAFLPVDAEEQEYYAPRRAGIYRACDFGLGFGNSRRTLVLAGYRSALDELAAQAPADTITVLKSVTIASHSPLRRHARDFMAPYLATIDFRDPVITLCSCLEPATLTTADQVRDLFERNPTTPVSIVHLVSELKRNGTRLGVVIGPAIPEGILSFPFPVVHVEKPEHVDDLATAVYELGIDLPASTGNVG
jgi:[acyl-carrier-protein] S-malonyltransferase